MAWLGDLSAFESAMVAAAIVIFALIAFEGWLLLQVMQQNGRLLLRLDALETGNPMPESAKASGDTAPGLPVGSPAPEFELPNLEGETVSLKDLTATGKQAMLFFVNPKCKKCTDLLPDIGRWQREHERIMTVALISRGEVDANREKVEGHGIKHVLLQDELEVAKAYQLTGTPTAVLVRPDGTIGSPLGEKAEGIRKLVQATVTAPVPSRPLPVRNSRTNGSANPLDLLGKPAPDARLSTLNGDEVLLSSLKGEPTALLFWNPGCGFCQRMLDDLKQLEANPPESVPRIVVISTGDAERNRAQGFSSTVLLDQGFSTGRMFGASGTPSAVLLDAEGRVDSPVAVGAPSVLSLATGDVPAGASN